MALTHNKEVKKSSKKRESQYGHYPGKLIYGVGVTVYNKYYNNYTYKL